MEEPVLRDAENIQLMTFCGGTWVEPWPHGIPRSTTYSGDERLPSGWNRDGAEPHASEN